jgi:Domain of unknown function (DUF6048)
LLLVMLGGPAYAQVDTTRPDPTRTDTAIKPKLPKPEIGGHQVTVGFDLFQPIINYYQSDRHGYDVEVDYYYRDQYYFVAEGGWGGSSVNYPDLKYSTKNTFYRLGINKNLMSRDRPDDWDMMFIGLRFGTASITRSSAAYTVTDSMWGNTNGTVTPRGFAAYWGEITAGMRVELFRGISAGWTLRGKFLINGSSFKDLAPLYIAGYGKGDNNAIFDANLYISYSIRWERPGAREAFLKMQREKEKGD